MSYMRHDAIIVTSWDSKKIACAANKARELDLEVLGPSSKVTNGIRTILVCPDGSKEGWPESNEYDAKRQKFLDYLNDERHEDHSTSLSWVAIAYGSDDRNAEITGHAWQNE